MDNSGWNMYVFRDGREYLTGEQARVRLLEGLARAIAAPGEDSCLAALIAAGEIECALSDYGSPSAGEAAHLTSVIADCFVANTALNSELVEYARRLPVPDELQLGVAEGFAYYALHPEKLLRLISEVEGVVAARVIGMRSIGTTLSAVVAAALRAKGATAERITVRPHGHPYERQLAFGETERAWLHEAGLESLVVIVDEGPGISGSSFLAVAEAVEQCGIAKERILMIGSRDPDPQQLRAPQAAARWKRFRFRAVNGGPVLPEGAKDDLGGGCWRRVMLKHFENQPASWTQHESAKYLSDDRKSVFKFVGYGHYGECLADRARKLDKSGYAPALMSLEKGFARFQFVPGRVLSAADINSAIVYKLAEYCAFRIREFKTDSRQGDLLEMVSWNWQCEFGSRLEPPVRLNLVHPVIADGRMQPHEWERADDGRLLKHDGLSHGDDHFFPGPCDIAWDLAGAIVEWDMNEQQRAEFLRRYRDLTDDCTEARLPDYLLTYAVFRMAWSKMAAEASWGSFDETLLRRDYERYRARAAELNAKRQLRAPAETTKALAVSLLSGKLLGAQ